MITLNLVKCGSSMFTEDSFFLSCVHPYIIFGDEFALFIPDGIFVLLSIRSHNVLTWNIFVSKYGTVAFCSPIKLCISLLIQKGKNDLCHHHLLYCGYFHVKEYKNAIRDVYNVGYSTKA